MLHHPVLVVYVSRDIFKILSSLINIIPFVEYITSNIKKKFVLQQNKNSVPLSFVLIKNPF